MNPKFSTNATGTDLVNQAQAAATKQMLGQPLNDKSMRKLAFIIREIIIAQAAAGLWKELGVSYGDLDQLIVIARRGTRALGEPNVAIEYDFTRTKIATFIVSNRADRPAKTGGLA